VEVLAPRTPTNAPEDSEIAKQPSTKTLTSSPTKNAGLEAPQTPDRDGKKKKKGIFGGLFGGKKGRKNSSRGQKLRLDPSGEGSI
jgi:hypothetical protein